jgi:septum formation protein
VLGKPEDDAQAVRMLSMLQGCAHEVITAVVLLGASGLRRDAIVKTRVWFRPLDEAAILRYVASGEGRDKAGSYAIQGLGAGFVDRIDGSYSNVVGLPAAQTLTLLESAGVVSAWP